MKTILAVTIAAASIAVSSAAIAGPCDYSWQTASDGSSCGGRAADRRPGGR
jgi:hypothetical protein